MKMWNDLNSAAIVRGGDAFFTRLSLFASTILKTVKIGFGVGLAVAVGSWLGMSGPDQPYYLEKYIAASIRTLFPEDDAMTGGLAARLRPMAIRGLDGKEVIRQPENILAWGSCPVAWCKSDGIVVISGEVGRLIVR